MTWTSARHEAAAETAGLVDEGCPCCGAETRYNDKTGLYRFLPGHDAKLVGRIVRLCRDDNSPLTWNDADTLLEYAGFPRLATKVSGYRLHFPNNGPTRKAARALVQRLDGGYGQFTRRACIRYFGADQHKHHATAEDCAIRMVLEGMTSHQILQSFS